MIGKRVKIMTRRERLALELGIRFGLFMVVLGVFVVYLAIWVGTL